MESQVWYNCNLVFWTYFCVTCFQSDPAHFYGFAYFRQVKDPSIQRGYFQKVCYFLNFVAKWKMFTNSGGLFQEIQKGGIVWFQKILISPSWKGLEISEGWGWVSKAQKNPGREGGGGGEGLECNITPYPQDINILPKHSQNSWLRLKNKKKGEVVTLVPSWKLFFF